MKRPIAAVVYFFVCVVCVATVAGCAASTNAAMVASPQTKDAVIVAFRDGSNVCQTSTTPRTNPSRGRRDFVRWTVVDRENCVDGSHEFRIEFKAGENPFESTCDLQDDKKVQCQLRDGLSVGTIKYSVRLVANDQVEDPELEIAM